MTILGFKKNDQSSVFGHVGSKLALTVVVDDYLWQIFKFNGCRSQRRLLNSINLPKAVVHNEDH